MYINFEEKLESAVTGLCFESKRPLILVSCLNGSIKLINYKLKRIVCEFNRHDGKAVRSVSFEKNRPFFVSGGDDYMIRVWDYQLRQCMFALSGHTGIIRTVEFHNKKPWIVSASDDTTIRIWNWESRECMSVLRGHKGHVMCALFHPHKDLMVSASLDKTVRIWDVTKPVGVVKYVLKGHEQGVNWASFHPSLPLIVSGANDHQVKVWQMQDAKACELDTTLDGHMDIVSCVLFHDRLDTTVVSTSEDKSICVWDATKRTGLQTFSREHDRFRILGRHPDMKLLAAGHDSGVIVFKLERERPAFSVSGDTLYFVKDGFLRSYEYSSQKETQLLQIRRPGSISLNQGPRTLSYNPTENAVLMCSDADGGSYELYIVPKDNFTGGDTVQEAKHGVGGSAVFVAQDRFAVYEKSTNQVLVKNLNNEIVKKSSLPAAATAIFYAGNDRLACREEDKMSIFDIQEQSTTGRIQAFSVRCFVLSDDMMYSALVAKNVIIITDKNLSHQCTLHENSPVKSGSFYENGVFIYTTLSHMKYLLPNGDSGIIKSLECPVYITKICGNSVFCFDRDGLIRKIVIDSTEFVFKLYVLKKRDGQVMSMVRNSGLPGHSMVPYLIQHGYPEVAIQMVSKERIMNEKAYWDNLAAVSLHQGHVESAKYIYKKTGNIDRLAFLHLITGDLEEISKLRKIARVKKDLVRGYLLALYSSNCEERVDILTKAGQDGLALATMNSYGYLGFGSDICVTIFEDAVPKLDMPVPVSRFIPPSPLLNSVHCARDLVPMKVVKKVEGLIWE